MDVLLPTLAKKFADTWLTMLILPGLLYAAALVVAHATGHRHAVDGAAVLSGVEELGRTAQQAGSAGTVLMLAAVVVVSAAAGYTARGLAASAQWVWLGAWGGPDNRLVRRRRTRWENAHERYANERLALDATGHADAAAQQRLGELAAARNRIALARPVRPTWIGDRFAAAEARLWAEYRIDLSFCWPRLWLVLPEETRHECVAARTGFDAAGNLAGWAALYLLLGCWWWPAAAIGIALALLAWRRGRQAASAFAELIESVVDVHGAALGRQLTGAGDDRPLDAAMGVAITERARKDA
ncbi:hypothetical protein [Streptomyces sp. NPDC046985]|uniref:hypothetical protein n=1 Tax=Streptomyces sp. NPDC046985 TaxID=3155377 RepID=UPI0033C21943